MKYRIENSKFVMDGQAEGASFRDLMKWQLGGGRVAWPRRVENRNYPPPPQQIHGEDVLVTWIGHSTALIQSAGLNILTDPFFSHRASPVQFAGPQRVRGPGVALQALPPIDVVLLSHNHFDHLDRNALLALAARHNLQVLTPLKNGQFLQGLNFKELDWRETVKFGAVEITLMPALHWSKRGAFDTNKALWGAFVISGPQGVIYFAGDTGYGAGETFKEVKTRFGAPKLSLLPIGAYEPRWFMRPQHMNPQEAVQAHLDLGSRKSIAIHHGTVQLTDEAIDAPVVALQKALLEQNLNATDFEVLDVGASVKV